MRRLSNNDRQQIEQTLQNLGAVELQVAVGDLFALRCYLRCNTDNTTAAGKACRTALVALGVDTAIQKQMMEGIMKPLPGNVLEVLRLLKPHSEILELFD